MLLNRGARALCFPAATIALCTVASPVSAARIAEQSSAVKAVPPPPEVPINRALAGRLPIDPRMLRYLPERDLFDPYGRGVLSSCDRFQARRRRENTKVYLNRMLNAGHEISFLCLFKAVQRREIVRLAGRGAPEAQYLTAMMAPELSGNVCISPVRSRLRLLSSKVASSAFSAGTIAYVCGDLIESRNLYRTADALGALYVQSMLNHLNNLLIRGVKLRSE